MTVYSKSALSSYESEDFKDISHTSIVTLVKFYGVSADYLLELTETKNHPNAERNDLHLSDEMITPLKSRKIKTKRSPDFSAFDEIKRRIEEAARFQGSDKEKRVVVLCRQSGIDYHKLTPKEFQTMIKILQESRLMIIPRKRQRETGFDCIVCSKQLMKLPS